MRELLAAVAAAAVMLLAPIAAGAQPKDPSQPSFAPIIKRVAPAVVNIAVRGTVATQANPFFDDPTFRRFFDAVFL